jgi:predicted SnoaL-like aldol condensation-catalyzing enzyme
MELTDKDKIINLIHCIESGAPLPASYFNPKRYIQHNLGIADGLTGFKTTLRSLPPGSAKAQVHRIYQDGNYVFAHTKYNFFGPKVGFNVFRFESGKIIEHWDNLQALSSHSINGRSQIDGPTASIDLELTEQNRALVADFIQTILIEGETANINHFIGPEERDFIQHNPLIPDGLNGLFTALREMIRQRMPMVYTVNHKILAEGNFVLTISQGLFRKRQVAFYDLFRLESHKIVEHWDTIEAIPPRAQWKNSNGKFGL